MDRKILYIQYTNPAGYPSLEHSSRILADKGWKILFLGTGAFGATSDLHFPLHQNITLRRLPFYQAGWLQKLHYIWFCAWVILWTVSWRPRLAYASDPLSCPIALILSHFPGIKVIYHEHDWPNMGQGLEDRVSHFMKFVLWSRKKLADRSKLCILPNEKRIERFAKEMGRVNGVFCVWNCPSLEEVKRLRPPHRNEKLTIYYHGTIARPYLPCSVLEAITMVPSKIYLNIIGYETIGSQGYVNYLKEKAHSLGIASRVEFLKPIPRYRLLEHCVTGDIGLAFIPLESPDMNNRYKIGASNRPFDYLACGLALLVSDLPDWKKTYMEPGYGLACDPEDPESIAACLRWFLEHPAEMRKMGELGRQRVISEWNYEKQFLPVEKQLNRRWLIDEYHIR